MSLGGRALALSIRLFWPLLFVSMALFQSYVVFQVCLASWKGLGVFLYPILGTVFVLIMAHLLLSYILTALTDPGKVPLASWVVPSGESLARLDSDATLFDHLTRSDADKNRAALERIKESLVPPEYLVFYCEFCRAPKPPRTHHCRFAFPQQLPPSSSSSLRVVPLLVSISRTISPLCHQTVAAVGASFGWIIIGESPLSQDGHNRSINQSISTTTMVMIVA